MKRLTLFLVTLLLSINCFAAEGFIEAGLCDFGQERNGVFWQEGRYMKNKLTTQCLALGFSGKVKKAWGWRAGLMMTSSWQHRSNVATYYDDEIGIEPGSKACDTVSVPGPGVEQGRGCYTIHSGSGNLRGFFSSITYEINLGSGFKLIPEMGLLFYRMKQDNSVTWLDPNAKPSYAPGNYNAGENRDLLKVPSPFIGVTLRYRDAYAYARHYESQGHHPLALTDGMFRQYGVGIVIYKF
jgi:hypothetical protein